MTSPALRRALRTVVAQADFLPDDMRADLDAWSAPPPRRLRRMRFTRGRRAEHGTKRWIKVPQWLVNDPQTPNEVFRVFSYFAVLDGKWCRKSLMEIAAEMRMNPNRLKQCVKILAQRKLIAQGERRKFHPTPRKATPYGDERWCPVPVDAVTALGARDLRVLALVGQARLRRVPDPTVDDLVAVCGFWSGKACKPSTIRASLRHLRKGGWMDHLADPVPPRPVMEEPVVEQEEGAVFEQPELIPVDVIRDIVEGPLTPQNDPDRFQEFWRAYPRKVGKGNARKAWEKALGKATAQTMINAAKQFSEWTKYTEPRWIPHAATWLNGERWDDEPDRAPEPRSTTDERVDQALEAGRRFIEKYGNVDLKELHRQQQEDERRRIEEARKRNTERIRQELREREERRRMRREIEGS